MDLSYSGNPTSVNYLDGTNSNYSVVIFNGYTDFKDNLSKSDNKGSGGRRRSITKFTPRSRNNLLKKIFSLSSYPSLFITLTYPKFFPADSEEWKRHLDNFRHQLLLRYPKAWFFWKLEPQRRGAPHYHLIGDLGCVANIFILRKYIAHLWFTTCGSYDPKHLKAGIQADYFNDSKGKMRAYVSKYVGKIDLSDYECWEHPGRFWGIIGRKNLPAILAKTIHLTSNQYYSIRRLVRRWLKRQSRNSRKYSKRLRSLHSFFLFIFSEVIEKILLSVVDQLPKAFPYVPQKRSPSAIYG